MLDGADCFPVMLEHLSAVRYCVGRGGLHNRVYRQSRIKGSS